MKVLGGAVLLAACGLLAGCLAARAAGTPHGVIDTPWHTAGAPDILLSLATDLGAFQAAVGTLPETLAILDKSGLASTGPYATHGYAYGPDGLGFIGKGWRVFVVDDRIRTIGKAWCIVRPPVGRMDDPALILALVPMEELSKP